MGSMMGGGGGGGGMGSMMGGGQKSQPPLQATMQPNIPPFMMPQFAPKEDAAPATKTMSDLMRRVVFMQMLGQM